MLRVSSSRNRRLRPMVALQGVFTNGRQPGEHRLHRTHDCTERTASSERASERVPDRFDENVWTVPPMAAGRRRDRGITTSSSSKHHVCAEHQHHLPTWPSPAERHKSAARQANMRLKRFALCDLDPGVLTRIDSTLDQSETVKVPAKQPSTFRTLTIAGGCPPWLYQHVIDSLSPASSTSADL